jgi:acyl dehydratase
MNYKVGDKAEITKTFNLADVKLFAELSGDMNPVHLSKEFAANTIFIKPIVHGFLYSSMISALLANELPGPGSIYIHQELNFKLPVFHGEKVTAKFQIEEIKPEKSIFILKTVCFKNDNEIVLTGRAIVKLLK